jgi:putative mRNA 3-end processing factor
LIAIYDSVLDQLLTVVRAALREGKAPVVHAYVLGKAQEVTRLLTTAGIPVLQHPKVYEVSQVYAECGVDLGDCRPYPGHSVEGHAVVVPPKQSPTWRVAGLKETVSIAVTGWAINPSTKYRLKVDHAIPLSDHADYDELFETVERVAPREIHCTHGPDVEGFANRLREAGHNAFPIGRASQMRLF